MLKVFKSNSYEAVSNRLNIRRPQHQYNTGNRDRLITPFSRVNAIKFNFQYQFTNIWNKVKDEIKTHGTQNVQENANCPPTRFLLVVIFNHFLVRRAVLDSLHFHCMCH